MELDYKYEQDRIFAEDHAGKLLAEINFPTTEDGFVDFAGTYVDLSLRGQGIGDQLVRAAIVEIRKRGVKSIVTCPYVKTWFSRHSEASDVLADTGAQE
jgi:predicted GNAT family acetyltransferase